MHEIICSTATVITTTVVCTILVHSNLQFESIRFDSLDESIRFPKKSGRSIRPQLGVRMQYLTTLSVFSMPDNTLNISFSRHYTLVYKSTAAD